MIMRVNTSKITTTRKDRLKNDALHWRVLVGCRRRDCPALVLVGGFFRSGFQDQGSYRVQVLPKVPCTHYIWDIKPLGQLRGKQRAAAASLLKSHMPLSVLKGLVVDLHSEDIRTGNRSDTGAGQSTDIMRKVRYCLSCISTHVREHACVWE
jgi:hypothetical protein